MSGDANGDLQRNVGDAVFIINYVFNNGTTPITCGNWLFYGSEACIHPDGSIYNPYTD